MIDQRCPIISLFDNIPLLTPNSTTYIMAPRISRKPIVEHQRPFKVRFLFILLFPHLPLHSVDTGSTSTSEWNVVKQRSDVTTTNSSNLSKRSVTGGNEMYVSSCVLSFPSRSDFSRSGSKFASAHSSYSTKTTSLPCMTCIIYEDFSVGKYLLFYIGFIV